MGLDYCTQCQTLEGKWTSADADGAEVLVCAECGGVETHKNIPEHDDGDMER